MEEENIDTVKSFIQGMSNEVKLDYLKIKCNLGNTPLHIVFKNGFSEIIPILLTGLTNTDIKFLLCEPNNLGESPYELGEKSEFFVDVLDELKQVEFDDKH